MPCCWPSSACPSSVRTIGRSGTEDEARRILGLARTELEFRRVDELVADLPSHLERLQAACAEAGTAVGPALLPPDRRHRMDPRRSLRPVSWRIAIRHRTGYHYGGGADVVLQRGEDHAAHHRPPDGAWRPWSASARAVPILRYIDYWGTFVDAFDIQEPHTDMVVTGTSVVETSAPAPIRSRASAGMTWPAHEVRDRYAELLAPTRRVPITDEVAETADDAGRRPLPRRRLPGGDRVGAKPAPVSAGDHRRRRPRRSRRCRRGSGVCQDFVHLTLAVLRAMGIPARYTSGYLHPSPEADVGATVEGQSHAWLEAWPGDWQAVDPTNGGKVGERHVIVGRARDYADVSPLKGIYHGAPSTALGVSVELTRLEPERLNSRAHLSGQSRFPSCGRG